jgi:hypothetical protein
MQAAIEQFRANIGHARHLGAIYTAFKAQTTTVVDLSDVLRAEIVMAVSALDHYVHEVVCTVMLQTYQGQRIKTPAFLSFSVSLESAIDGINSPGRHDWLINEIRTRHGWQSFQHADKLADALRLITDLRIWDEVGSLIGMTAADAKRRLNLIVDRRNKIAHEADMDQTNPGHRWPIDEVLVQEAVAYVEEVAEAIHQLL